MDSGWPSLLIREGVQAAITARAGDVGVDDLLRPVRLGLRADVEDLDAVLVRELDGSGDELGAGHGQLGVVHRHHGLLGGCRHDEQVGEAPGHHAEEAGRPIGPLLGQGDAVPAHDVVTGPAVERRALGLEAGAVDDGVDLVLPLRPRPARAR